jgi:hypothetical protein
LITWTTVGEGDGVEDGVGDGVGEGDGVTVGVSVGSVVGSIVGVACMGCSVGLVTSTYPIAIIIMTMRAMPVMARIVFSVLFSGPSSFICSPFH